MTYFSQVVQDPSVLIGPVLSAAIISGFISYLASWRNRVSTSADVDRKIIAERDVTDLKLSHEREKAIGDRAWADYGLRRDIYLDLIKDIDDLINPGNPDRHRAFMVATRKVRLIGSDEVVTALNQLTSSIKNGSSEDARAKSYSELFNAIRKDIRTLNVEPPIGTALDEAAFPIEG